MKFSLKNISQQYASGKSRFFLKHEPQKELVEKAAFFEKWEHCRGLFHSPILQDPQIGPPPGEYRGAHHNLATGQTWIDLEFAKEVAKKGKADFDLVLKGLMVRQIAAYMKFPRTLANVLIMEKVAGELCKDEGKDFARFLVREFSALCAECCCVLEANKSEAILELRRALANANPEHPLNRIILAYLSYQARKRNEEFNDVEREVELLKGANFVAAAEDICELRRAMMIVKRVALMAQPQKPSVLGFGKSKLKEALGQAGLYVNDIDQFPALANASTEAIRKALAEAALKLSWKEFAEVEKIVENFGLHHDWQEVGFGWREGIEADAKTVQRYLALLENYPVSIQKMPIESEGGKKVVKGTERFCIESPIYKAMVYTSGGKILPGVTRMIGSGMRKRTTVDYKAPDALLIIDSSDSMPNPATTKSALVASAMATAKAYLSLGAEIAVVNFGPRSYYLDYTKQEQQIFLSLVAKQHGGTKLDLDLARKLIEQAKGKPIENAQEQEILRILLDPLLSNIQQEAFKKEVMLSPILLAEAIKRRQVDIFMFSDMKIANIREVLNMIYENSSTNRFVIVCNKKFTYQSPFSGKLRVYDEVTDVEKGIEIAISEARQIAGY